MLSAQVHDVIDATQHKLQEAAPRSVGEVRQTLALVSFSQPVAAASSGLKQFLLHKLYRHPQVMQTTGEAKRVVAELFAAYCDDPRSMQPGAGGTETEGAARVLERVVADYIAGMTDRFALRAHERLTGLRLLV